MPYLVRMSFSRQARRYIAIDLGASSGRVLEICIGEAKLSQRELHRFPNAPVWNANFGRWCWDTQELWNGVLHGLRAAARDGPVDSIGIDAWAVDYALMDEEGNLVQPVAAYRDGRTQRAFREIRDRVGDASIYETTGIAFQPFNTLYQLAADAQDASRPLDRATQLLMIPDLIAYWLCGARTTEATNASTTQLFDAATRSWSGSLAEAAGVPFRLLPAVTDAGCPNPLGSLRPEVARETGLAVTTRVFATATHDTASSVIAAPIEPTEDLYISSGTWSLVGAELPSAIRTDAARRANMTNELGAFGSVRFLRNVAGMWLVQQCEHAFALEGRARTWSELAALAADEPPLVSVIDPNDPALFEAGDMPNRIRSLCAARGEPTPTTDGAIVRCALESVALATAWAALEAARIARRRIRKLVVVGGGSANDLLNQMIADAAGVAVACGPIESTAIGNALVQHAALEGISSAQPLRALVRNATPIRSFEPNPDGLTRMREAAARPGF